MQQDENAKMNRKACPHLTRVSFLSVHFITGEWSYSKNKAEGVSESAVGCHAVFIIFTIKMYEKG